MVSIQERFKSRASYFSVQKLNQGSMCDRARQVRQLYRLPCKIALAVFWPITINHKGSVCQKYI